MDLDASPQRPSSPRSPGTFLALHPSAASTRRCCSQRSRSCRSTGRPQASTTTIVRRPRSASQTATPTTGRPSRSRSSWSSRSGRKTRTTPTPASRSLRPATCLTRYATPDTTQILHDWRENWREQPFRAPLLWAVSDATARPAPPQNPVPALLDVHPRDRTGDHELLDLGGALEDVVDLRVAVP